MGGASPLQSTGQGPGRSQGLQRAGKRSAPCACRPTAHEGRGQRQLVTTTRRSSSNAEQQLIIGGLRRGQNALQLRVKELPIEKDDERFLQVEAVLLTNDQAKPTVPRSLNGRRRFEPVPPVVSLTITINNLTQKGI